MIASWASDIHYDASDILSKEKEEERRDAQEQGRYPDLNEYESATKVNEDGIGIALAKELGRQSARQNTPVTEALGSMIN